MNYPAMRWAVEDCRLEGAAKPILFVIAYRADRDSAECWAGQRRIAREAGVDPKTVERVIPRLIADGVLELVEPGSGPRPNCYRIAPAWVEGEAFASGVVEGATTASALVEGQGALDGVIHRPPASADIASALDRVMPALVPTSDSASADIGHPLVPTLGAASADMVVPLSSENGEKVLEGLDTRKEQVRDAAARAAGGVAASEPPPITEADKRWLEYRGLRPKSRPGNGTLTAVDSRTRSREEQLAELERQIEAEKAKGETA
jgi:hypothetical protein